jgi:polyketide cyclase/dehydrase/lipid transport protein
LILPVVIDTGLSLLGIVLIISGLIVYATGLRSSEFVIFDSRTAMARRVMAAAFIPLALELLGTGSLVGIAIVALAVLWSISWLPERRRRFAVGAEAVFRSPPESVAAVMFDVSAQPKWMEAIREAVLESPGLLRVGSVIRQRSEVQGRSMVARLRVDELEPYHKLVLVLQVEGPPAVDILEVTPLGAGSRVRYGGSHELPLLLAILGGWRLGSLRRRFERQRTAGLERLRELVEPPIGRSDRTLRRDAEAPERSSTA